jgi:hypothetical protein
MVDRIPALLSKYWNRGLLIFFGLGLLGAWVAWILIVTESVPALSEQVQLTAPGYVPRIQWIVLIPALLMTAGFVFWAVVQNVSSGRVVMVNWGVGLLVGYTLAMTIFLPITNIRMGYRNAFVPMREHLPPEGERVASLALGESERALLHYLTGLKTLRVEVHPDALEQCHWVLIQGDHRDGHMMDAPPSGSWELIFEGRRGKGDSFRLYRRIGESSSSPDFTSQAPPLSPAWRIAPLPFVSPADARA